MKLIIDKEQALRTLRRISHEIIENNDDLKEACLVGIKSKGMPLCRIIKENIQTFTGIDIAIEEIDISNYRDDSKKANQSVMNFKTPIKDKTVILVDDVLYTGRSVRAAMDALMDLGRVSKIELAVMVDRGHRELPIRADFVGKNIPTAKNEQVYFDCDNLSFYLK